MSIEIVEPGVVINSEQVSALPDGSLIRRSGSGGVPMHVLLGAADDSGYRQSWHIEGAEVVPIDPAEHVQPFDAKLHLELVVG